MSLINSLSVWERKPGLNGSHRQTYEIDQRTISNNQEIFETISRELKEAQQEILVVAAWFTDSDLLRILKEKAEAGLNVQIIVSDNEDNRKLEFDSFPDAESNVLRVKNVGYGMMHQKYCVIDREKAIHGSYNWTVNAKKNNHESVIITNHQQTVDELVKNFENIKQRLKEISELGLEDAKAIKAHFKSSEVSEESEPIEPKRSSVEVIDQRKRDYEQILDTMIAAEVSHYNRSEIAAQGYELAKTTNGDYQILGNAFDSVYSSFIADIDALEDKKHRLLNRIDEQRSKNIQSLKENQELEINSISKKYETKEQVQQAQVATSKVLIEQNESKIDKYQTQELVEIQEQIDFYKEEINKQERDFITPGIKWFELIPAVIINLGLFIYLFLFYSSAAYILMFSELDAKEEQLRGDTSLPPEVFNPNALGMALDKGGTAILFILLFVFVPMTLAIVGRLKGSKKGLPEWSVWVLILVVDAFIAFVVSKSIHEVEYLTGKADEIWHWLMIFGNPNFYLVFIMGALGLFLFKFSFDKLIGIFEDRNPQIAELRSKKLIEQYREKIKEYKDTYQQKEDEIHQLSLANIEHIKTVQSGESEINQLPEYREAEIARLKSETSIIIDGITRITDVYVSYIENDNYLISIHAVKDRISTFLEGWYRFLHEEYSITKANNITKLSYEAASAWKQEKLVSKNLDSRIKQ